MRKYVLHRGKGKIMCEFCENIGIGLPNWNFMPDDDSETVPSGIEIEIRKNIIKKIAKVLQDKYIKKVTIQFM